MEDTSAGAALSFIPVPGVRLSAVAAGIRYQNRDDLCLIELAPGTQCAAVFTRNAFCAAPVILAQRHLATGILPRYFLINSGNANAGTGSPGLTDAGTSCAALAALAGCRVEEILPFSTGIIGEPLPLDRLVAALPAALSALNPDRWPVAARAIMTTDTRPKLVSRRLVIAGREAVITGIAKGAGMIRPDMATMLAFLATDVAITPGLLQACLAAAVDVSFNAISIDGDTSTNDACALAATGALGNPPISDPKSVDYQVLKQAIEDVCRALATAIVRDGEGATKCVTLLVEEAATPQEARRVAETIAHSPLVKTALFASDPNWGRILAAVGRAGIQDLDIERVRLWLGPILIVSKGGRDPSYTEEAGRQAMAGQDILIRVALGRGQSRVEMLTCDLSYDYVKINAAYRT